MQRTNSLSNAWIVLAELKKMCRTLYIISRILPLISLADGA